MSHSLLVLLCVGKRKLSFDENPKPKVQKTSESPDILCICLKCGEHNRNSLDHICAKTVHFDKLNQCIEMLNIIVTENSLQVAPPLPPPMLPLPFQSPAIPPLFSKLR